MHCSLTDSKSKAPEVRSARVWPAIAFSLACLLSTTSQAGELTIESPPGEALLLQLPVAQTDPATDTDCFSLQQSQNSAPLHLEYTRLSKHDGILMLWSDIALEQSLQITLTDHCQQTHQTFRLQPDQSVSQGAVINLGNPKLSPRTSAPTQTASNAPPVSDAPANDPAYQALTAQLNALQASMAQLQERSDTLYAAHVMQTQAMATTQAQHAHLTRENHLLRILALCLGITLTASGYFFADWLRRHSARPAEQRPPVQSNARAKQEHATGTSSPAPDTANPPPTPINPPTVSPIPTGRSQPVPRQANDDVHPERWPMDNSGSAHDTRAIMDDASRLLTHGRTNQAIEHLQQYLYKQPKCSPWMWLYLLDLLAKEGKQQEFDMMASECRRHYNLNVERNPDHPQQGIESFPRIMKALQQAWGTPQVITLIDDLTNNTRLVPRMGFERSVFEDLMLLREVACRVQNLPAGNTLTSTPSRQQASNTAQGHLRELQQLSDDIFVLAPAAQKPFHYWTDFIFELDAPTTRLQSA